MRKRVLFGSVVCVCVCLCLGVQDICLTYAYSNWVSFNTFPLKGFSGVLQSFRISPKRSQNVNNKKK